MRLKTRSCLLAALFLWPGLSLGASVEPAAPLPAAPISPVATLAPGAAPPPPASAPQGLNETQQYCQNIAAAAADARFAWQRKQLNDLDAQLKQRIADLEAREATLKEALAHRDDVMKRANDTVVGIYAKMKPDAAAQQLTALDDEMAAAILAQLTQKQASTILNEIPAEHAAKLIVAITTAASAGKKS